MANQAQPSPLLNSLLVKGGVAVGQGGIWDELVTGQENPCSEVIVDTSEMLMQMATVIEEAGTGNAEYEVLMTGAIRDIKEYSRRFESIRSQRKGRTGHTTSSEDYTDYIQIGMHYIELLDSMRTVLSSTVVGLTDHYQQAYERLKELNPSEVTDVAVKEAVQDAPAQS